MNELELKFHLLMRSVYERAKSECGYNAIRFKRMLQDHQGVGTARILLRAPTVSDGFVELYSRSRLDLTVEAQVLTHPEFWVLFDQKDLDTARRWLSDHGWKAP